ncbi:uncharacterized protein LOC141628393 [Silene latifolia]|uniref:uncharacterized protein LOC141628393 n=1 Tax=Silene latifolia TaxID=37657 RepID=UPI003D77271A
MVFNFALLSHLITVTPQNTSGLEDRKKFDNEKKNKLSSEFRMPLNYPRYNKEDYAKMEEWKVDMLLKQYGLDNHVNGTLEEKRKFAMGAFLWPDQL